jgi:hypothetical protein
MIRTEALGVHGDGGHRSAGGSRTEAEASTGRRSEKHDGWRPDRKGYVSPCDRLCIK